MRWKNAWMTAAAVAFAAAGLPGEARAEGRKIRAEIPFAFQAGSHVFPPGTYEFEPMAARPVLVVTTPEGERIAMLTHPAGRPEAPPVTGLVFEREGGEYTLAEVWAPGATHRAGVAQPKQRGPVPVARQRVRIVAAVSGR